MKAAVFYYSRHHGNTRKVLEAMAREGGLTLVDVTGHQAVRLEEYDCVASPPASITGSFRRRCSNAPGSGCGGKGRVFCLYLRRTPPRLHRGHRRIAREKNCPVLGEYGCKGYDTFGPFRLVGGIAKGHPDGRELEAARAFYRKIWAPEAPGKPGRP